MDIIAQKKLESASQIYYCLVKTAVNNKCAIVFNDNEYTVPYYGGAPTPNKTYALFLPQNNINQAFVIGEGGSGGGGGSGIAVQPDPPLGDELVWVDTDDPGQLHIIPEINDNVVNNYDTWSSQKISTAISESLLNFVYPVGSIYMSVNSTNPSIILGGTWEQIEDVFLLSAGQTYTAGDTGGEAEHTLTTDEMPSHNGHVTGKNGGTLARYLPTSSLTSYGSAARGWTEVSGSEAYPAYQSIGGGQAHNNMPPYLVVYMWKRTA